MFTAFRSFAQSWAAKVLMGLLILSMGAFGISRYGFQAIKGDEVIRAGSRVTTSAEFKREYDNYKRQLEQERNGGQPIPPALADANHLDQVVLSGLATREAFSELLSKIGVRPSDKLVLSRIQQIPEFFDPITGKFDRKTFERMLGQNGMTPKMLDTDIRDRNATQDWAAGVQNGLQVPRAYGALAAVYALETRDVAYFLLPPSSVPAPAKPTDAQLTAFIAQNKSQYSLPEMRELTVVAFTPDTAGDLGPVDPAELKKRYDFRKDTLSKPETRTLEQIPVKSAGDAPAVLARVQKGEPVAAIAKSLGVVPNQFADKPMTAIPDRKAAEQIFKLASGSVAIVQGDLGTSVVRVVSVTPGQEMTLEQARPMLEAEIRKDMLAQKVYNQTTAFDDARQGGASLADAAAKVGVKTTHIDPISKDGVNAQGAQLQNFPPKILEVAFAQPQGGESETTELGNGVSFAVRVEKIIPAHVPGLEELRPRATADLMRRDLINALEAKAKALSARVEKGEAIEAVAGSAGASVVKIAGLSRQNAQSHADAPREVLGRALAARPNEVWTTRTPAALAVGKVSNIAVEAGPNTGRLAEQARGELTQTVFREMAEAASSYARTKLKVRTDPARARAAAGFEPLENPKAKGKPEKKG